MTDDREKELFDTLSTLVHGVNGLTSDVRDIKVVLDKHSHILDRHSHILDRHSEILDRHSETLGEHSSRLNLIVSKVDSIAEQVMQNDKRLSARIVTLEQAVEHLGGELH